MTWAGQGDRLALVTAGVANAAAQNWRGGIGCLTVTALSGTPDFEMSPDNGVTWLDVKDMTTGAPITAIAAAAMFLVLLPACRVRMSAGGGSMEVLLTGV